MYDFLGVFSAHQILLRGRESLTFHSIVCETSSPSSDTPLRSIAWEALLLYIQCRWIFQALRNLPLCTNACQGALGLEARPSW